MLTRVVAAGCVIVAAASAAIALEPHVPYVPTAANVVDAMLEIAKVGPRDYLIDLGSGDGRIVIAAARRHGTHGLGVDLDKKLVARANEAAKQAGVEERATFQVRDLFITDISRATVLTLYLFQSVNLQLRPRLFAELRPGTRVVSHDFDMDEWQPDEQITIPVPDKPYGAPESQVYLWVIPANAAGLWVGTINAKGDALKFRAELDQNFQTLAGTAQAGAAVGKVRGGRLRGESLRFAFETRVAGRGVLHEFEGRVKGDTVAGTVTWADGVVQDWNASRVRPGRIKLSAVPTEL